MFRELKLSDIHKIKKIVTDAGKAEESALSVPVIFLWKNEYKLKIDISDEGFTLKRDNLSEYEGNGNFRKVTDKVYYFPVGTEGYVAKKIEDIMQEGTFIFQYLNSRDIEYLNEKHPGRFEIYESRGDWDYLYSLEEQIAQKGRSFKRIRNKINRNLNDHIWEIRSVDEDNLGDVEYIGKVWNETHFIEGGRSDLEIIKYALKYRKELNLFGEVVYADGAPVAFILASYLTNRVVDIHLSKAILSGIDFSVKWFFYKSLPSDVLYINREDDLDQPGLRLHKNNMKPFSYYRYYKGKYINEHS